MFTGPSDLTRDHDTVTTNTITTTGTESWAHHSVSVQWRNQSTYGVFRDRREGLEAEEVLVLAN